MKMGEIMEGGTLIYMLYQCLLSQQIFRIIFQPLMISCRRSRWSHQVNFSETAFDFWPTHSPLYNHYLLVSTVDNLKRSYFSLSSHTGAAVRSDMYGSHQDASSHDGVSPPLQQEPQNQCQRPVRVSVWPQRVQEYVERKIVHVYSLVKINDLFLYRFCTVIHCWDFWAQR